MMGVETCVVSARLGKRAWRASVRARVCRIARVSCAVMMDVVAPAGSAPRGRRAQRCGHANRAALPTAEVRPVAMTAVAGAAGHAWKQSSVGLRVSVSPPARPTVWASSVVTMDAEARAAHARKAHARRTSASPAAPALAKERSVGRMAAAEAAVGVPRVKRATPRGSAPPAVSPSAPRASAVRTAVVAPVGCARRAHIAHRRGCAWIRRRPMPRSRPRRRTVLQGPTGTRS